MKRPLPWLFAAAVVGGATVGAAWPALPLPKLSRAGGAWQLPSSHDIARHIPQDMAVVAADMRWKGEGKNGGTAAAEDHSDWSLAGILQQQTATILTMSPGKAAEASRVAIGENLPDGSLLLSIKGDQVITKRGSCLTTYAMFHAAPIAQSDGCK